MNRPADPTRHVALVVETSNAYARGLLAGVRQYLESNLHWSIYIGEHSRQDTDLSWLDGWAGDGIIARVENAETAAKVRALRVPVVDLSAARLVPEFPCVETDDDQIARLAVEHFAGKGIRSFAFCGDSRFGWSVKRSERFRAHVRTHGSEAFTFGFETAGTAMSNRRSLATWLAGLPKPVGVLACYDIAGQEVLEACKIAALDVPDAVAVLGVDNDELLCNLTSPPMSSIMPDAARAGYFAASLLDEMIAGGSPEPALHLIPAVRVVERQSTDLLAVDDEIVAKSVRYIRDNSTRSVRVAEVTEHVGLSRRALDYRFTRVVGRSVHAEISRARMERVSELLLRTEWTLPRIAEHLGFPHSEYMGVAFRREMSLSPGGFRSANTSARPVAH